MSQCVPSWDLDDSSAPAPAPARPSLNLQTHSNSSNSLAPDVPSLDYEVAELTWENGQLAMQGLGPPRMPNKPPVHFSPPAKYAAAWEKPRAGTGTGTLESIVNQATCHVPQLTKSTSAAENNAYVTPWFDHRRAVVNSSGGASMAVTMDALVPCNNRNNHHRETSRHVAETAAARAGVCSCKTSTPSASESTGTGVKERRQVMATFENREREFGAGGFTSTSMWSADNTSSGKEYTKTTSGEDHDSVCHSRPQRNGDDGEVGTKKGNGKSSGSTKRIRAAAIHNQSERKRRDKINQRMKTLQKLVPNSSKTDKASILDEVIGYLKQLQAQVHMMNRMNIPQMMLPQLALQQQQQLQMSMIGMGMGMGIMDLNALSRAAAMPPIIPPSGMPSVMQPPAAFMSMPSWDMQPADPLASAPVMPELLSAFLACQSQPNISMDAYSRLAALYHQFQQGPASASDSRPGFGSKN